MAKLPIAVSDDELPSDLEDQDGTGTLAEGQLYDFITNQPVQDSPVERTLQTVARSLVDEYGFDHTQLARDQSLTYELIDGDGKARKMRQRVSVAVFPEGIRKTDASQIIRACLVQPPTTKANDPKRGVDLLEQEMGALPACDYGLWTNGTDLIFKQKLTGGGRLQPEYVDLYDLPGYAETASDLDQPDRQVGRIATGDNLQRTFARVHDYIYGNQGLKKDAAYWQVLNLIFCKIHDERSTGMRRFWVRGTERNTTVGQAAIAGRIRALFDEVKQDSNYAAVFSVRDQIDLRDRVLAYVVGELSRYNLIETDVDVKGAAYEEITSSVLKAQRGQFFTPSNGINLMVEIMDPGGDADLTDPANWPLLLDVACGSGRMLTYGLNHIRRKLANQLFPQEHPLLRVHRLEKDPQASQLLRRYAATCLYGIDFDPDLKRAARMNMILNNDGHGNILSFNSLEYPLMLGRTSVGQLRQQWAGRPVADLPDAVRARLEIDLGMVDFVFTNPPFGAKIPVDEPAILELFDLGHRWSKDRSGGWIREGTLQSRVAPEVLFVERCVQWVKPGTGKVAIVLPDGILGNPDAEHIRYWILTHCQVLASVDLPVEAFLPQVGVQASLLFLRRKSQAEMDAEALGHVEDYPVFMAIAETVGHDRRGNTIYVRDPDGAETIFTETKDVLRRRRNKLLPASVTLQEKRVDDDLPHIAEAYRQFLKTGQVPA
jgi:type I restriction enzyme M protein